MSKGFSLVAVHLKENEGSEVTQAKIFRALRGGSDVEKEQDDICIRQLSFDGLDDQTVRQVAVSTHCVGVRLNDGRVARFLYSRHHDPIETSPSVVDDKNAEPKERTLQDISDESYAHQLQERLNRGDFQLGDLFHGNRDVADAAATESDYAAFSASDYNNSPPFNPWHDAAEHERTPSPSLRRYYSPSPPGRRRTPEWFETDAFNVDLESRADLMDAREDEFEEARVREEKAAKRAAAVRERERKEGTEKEKGETVNEWPVVGNLEWLDVDSSDISFTDIAALHSELLLVSSGDRKLYSWPVPDPRRQGDERPRKFSVHRLSESMWPGEEIALVATCNVRASVVMKSGKIATFYDELLRDSPKGTPSLISVLSHPAKSMSGIEKEKIVEIKTSEFITVAMTAAGKVYWWGLMPPNEVEVLRDQRQARKKRQSEIVVGARVKLDHGLPTIPGSLIYTSACGLGPRIGELLPAVENFHADYNPRIHFKLVSDSSSTETLDMKEITFLESEAPELGRVVGFDNSNNAIVEMSDVGLAMVSQIEGGGAKKPASTSKFNVFPLSSLEALKEETNPTTRTSSSRTWHGFYQIQHVPTCLIDPNLLPPNNDGTSGGVSSTTADERIKQARGYRAVAVTTTGYGVNALVVRDSDSMVFFVTAMWQEIFGSRWRLRVVAGRVDEDQGGRIVGGGVTHEAEAVLADAAKLSRGTLGCHGNDVVRKRRKLADDEIVESTVVKPTIVSLGDPRLILLLDGNGALYPRYMGTRLKNHPIEGVPPMWAIGVGERAGFDAENKSKIVFAVAAFKKQLVIPALESRSVSAVQQVLLHLASLPVAGDDFSPPSEGSSKKARFDYDSFTIDSTLADTTIAVASKKPNLRRIVNERKTGNRNILHVACSAKERKRKEEKAEMDDSTPSYEIGNEYRFHSSSANPKLENWSFEERRAEHYSEQRAKLLDAENKPEAAERQREKKTKTLVIDLLLNDKTLRPFIPELLCERDVLGRTPFLTALGASNYKTASRILAYVEQQRDARLFTRAIAPPTFNDLSPLHMLAMPGIGRSPLAQHVMLVARLPKLYTASQLLRLFQVRYPSAYRAVLFKRLTEDEAGDLDRDVLESVDLMLFGDDVDGVASRQDQRKAEEDEKRKRKEESSVRGRRRLRLRRGSSSTDVRMDGLVFFSDVDELRHGMIDMQHFSIFADMPHNPGNSFTSVQHLLRISCLGDDFVTGEKGYGIDYDDDSDDEEEDGDVDEAAANEENEGRPAGGSDDVVAAVATSRRNKLLKQVKEERLRCELMAKLLSFDEISSWTDSSGDTALSWLIHRRRLLATVTRSREKLVAELERTARNQTTTIAQKTDSGLDDEGPIVVDDTPEEKDKETEVATPSHQTLRFDGVGASPFSNGAPSVALNPFAMALKLSHDFTGATDLEPLPVATEFQMVASWPMVATTLRGYLDEPGSDQEETDSRRVDAFVVQLMTEPNEKLVNELMTTIVREMARRSRDDGDDRSVIERLDQSEAFRVGRAFVRALARYIALIEGNYDPADVPPSLGPSLADRALKRCRVVMATFGFLAVSELAESAESILLPVRLGVAKPQTIAALHPNSITSLTNTSFGAMRLAVERRRRGPGEIDARLFFTQLRSAVRLRAPSAATSRCHLPVSGLRLCHNLTLYSWDESDESDDDADTALPGRVYWADPATNDDDQQPMDESFFSSTSNSDDSDDSDDGGRGRRQRRRRRGRAQGSRRTQRNFEDYYNPPDEDTFTEISPLDHPFSWAVDARGIGGIGNGTAVRNPNAGNPFSQNPTPALNPIHVPSLRYGVCYLARLFGRMVKETMDVLQATAGDKLPSPLPLSDYPLGQEKEPSEEGLVKLELPPDAVDVLCIRVVNVLEKSWQWVAQILDIFESQLIDGTKFDAHKYAKMLRADREERPRRSDPFGSSKDKAVHKGAKPPEYLNFLLKTHTNEGQNCMPILDAESYEHVVYVLDALMYTLNKWHKTTEIYASRKTSADADKRESDASLPRFIGHSDSAFDREQLLNEAFFDGRVSPVALDVPITEQSQFMGPFAPPQSNVFDRGSQVTSPRQAGMLAAAQRKEALRTPVPKPLMVQWSAEAVSSRWRTAIDLFSQLFFADGPGAERSNFLSVRAGFAGRMARFRRHVSALRHGSSSSSRATTSTSTPKILTFEIRRDHLLQDTLKVLETDKRTKYVAVRCRFVGEEGSGPGVTRGFFASVANELKKKTPVPPGTSPLFFEPGKQPQQAGLYSPHPFWRETPRDKEQRPKRNKIFYFVGKFLGYCLWFHHPIPFMLSRHVAKYLLGRDIAWHDLAFYNVELFEGLRKMMEDADEKKMGKEEFLSTYCLHFEATIAGKLVELIPNGSKIPVTPDRVKDYVRHYAVQVMVDSVKGELSNLRDGLKSVINSEQLQGLTAEDFQLLLSGGASNVSIQRLKSVITFNNAHGCTNETFDLFKKWFWRIVAKLNVTQRQQLLYFATGSAALPTPGDISHDVSAAGPTAITIDVVRGGTSSLPMASTCGQRMTIPLYGTRRIFRKKLLQAIQCQIYGLG